MLGIATHMTDDAPAHRDHHTTGVVAVTRTRRSHCSVSRRRDHQQTLEELAGGELCALDAGANLGERDFACGRRVVTEGGEATVVSGAELREWDELRRLEHPVSYLLRRLHLRVDGIGHTDEDPLSWPQACLDREQY